MIYEHRNPMYERDGGITCEINHPEEGWVPYTARADDSASKDLHAAMVAEGGIAPFRTFVFEVNGEITVSPYKPDIPVGAPYLALTDEEIPVEPINTWEVDFSVPDGFGTGGM